MIRAHHWTYQASRISRKLKKDTKSLKAIAKTTAGFYQKIITFFPYVDHLDIRVQALKGISSPKP
jgi:hypothetical protein